MLKAQRKRCRETLSFSDVPIIFLYITAFIWERCSRFNRWFTSGLIRWRMMEINLSNQDHFKNENFVHWESNAFTMESCLTKIKLPNKSKLSRSLLPFILTLSCSCLFPRAGAQQWHQSGPAIVDQSVMTCHSQTSVTTAWRVPGRLLRHVWTSAVPSDGPQRHNRGTCWEKPCCLFLEKAGNKGCGWFRPKGFCLLLRKER